MTSQFKTTTETKQRSNLLKKWNLGNDQNLTYFIWDVVDLFCIFGQSKTEKREDNKKTNCESEEINRRRRDRHRSIFTFVVPEGLAADLSSALLSPHRAHSRERWLQPRQRCSCLLCKSPTTWASLTPPWITTPKLEEMIMLNSAGTPFLNATAPEGTGFGSGEPGDHFDHLAGGKH